MSPVRPLRVVGRSLRRPDAMDKVTGRARYVTDLHGSADYKREMAQVFLRRALRIAASRAMGEAFDARYPHTVVV